LIAAFSAQTCSYSSLTPPFKIALKSHCAKVSAQKSPIKVWGHDLPENALMRLVVISIGRLKQGPERELTERYRGRFDDIGRKLGFRRLELHEIPESRARDTATRMAEEAAAISAAIPEKSGLVALDERGDNIDSATFARHLGRWRDESVANTIFVIGGADGLSPDLRRKAKLTLAFGSATWPHQMVRIMLLEQIYRAATILAGHPYHRA
jgi:23S rRNA (pseudouridine1915-N3)-methyltransferase